MCIGSAEMGKAQLGQCSEAQWHSGDERRIGEAAKGKEKYGTAEALHGIAHRRLEQRGRCEVRRCNGIATNRMEKAMN